MSTYDRFRGLVRCTARIIQQQRSELEVEDIEQTLWLRICKVVPRFKAERGLAFERYVFMCLTDAKKDILKRRRHRNSSLEELRGERRFRLGTITDSPLITDWFDERFASYDGELCTVEVEDLLRSLPLGPTEREFVGLRIEGHSAAEAGRRIGRDGWRVSESVRAKLGDPSDFLQKVFA